MRTARHFRFSAPSAILMATLVAAGVGSSGARAEDAAQLADVYATLKSLQARIDTLDAENRAVKQETANARAEARDLRKKLGSSPAHPASPAAPATLATPSPAYAMATKAPPPLPPAVPSWGGLYAGAAFGLASLHSQVDETSQSTFFETVTSIPPGLSQVLTQTFNSAGSLSGRNFGAVANLFLGYNVVLSDRYIVGGQVEGGVSNIRVNLNGTSSTVVTSTVVSTPGGTQSATQTSTSSATDALDNKWMVSALARGGVLLDPVDYVYLLGGWTYGRFEFGQSFGLNGATIGAGWERQVAPGWTLRAEGRYTKFETKTLTSNSTSNTASTSTTAVFNINSVSSDSDRISADMWSVWLGFAHTFN